MSTTWSRPCPTHTRCWPDNGLYGDYFGFYLCDAVLKVNGKGGQPVYVKLAGQDTGTVHTEVTAIHAQAAQIKPLAERNRFVVGLVGIAVLVAVVVAAFSYDKIPFVKGTTDYSAYFAEAGGIKPGSDVRVSGMAVGRVADVQLDGTKVLVDFTVATASNSVTGPRPRSRPRPCSAPRCSR